MIEQKEFQKRSERIERLIERTNALADPQARATAQELLQAVMDLHGAVLERVLEMICADGEHGRELLGKLADDPLVSGLLLLYDLHPEGLEVRVARALERLKPALGSQKAAAELIEIKDGAVRLRLTVQGCASTAAALKEALEQAIYEVAPEVSGIGVEDGNPAAVAGFVPLAKLGTPAA